MGRVWAREAATAAGAVKAQREGSRGDAAAQRSDSRKPLKIGRDATGGRERSRSDAATQRKGYL